MSHAQHNRGSRIIARRFDSAVAPANARADRAAERDASDGLRAEVERLRRELARARRCLAAERTGRAALAMRLGQAEASYQFSVNTLCRIAARYGAPGFE